jgi:putative FmdB family regulatory protein
MPVYEYECPACEKVFEVQQRMTEQPLETCPECGGQVRKLISMSSFQLKGGGWYADGYSGGCKTAGTTQTASTPPCQSGDGACKSCPAAG